MTEPADRGEARAEARIEAALSRLGAEHEPPPGWETRVLAAIAPEPRRRPWWVFAAPGLAVAAAAAIVVIVVLPPEPFELALSPPLKDPHEPRRVTRGNQDEYQYQVNDTVRATVAGGAPHRALWVYRDGRELVVACPRDPACRVSSDGISVDFALKTVGDYQVMALNSSEPPPEPSGSYDADTAALMRARIEPKVRKFHVP